MSTSALIEATVTCPYCGEVIDLLLEPEAIGECTIEDCRVCCRPIVLSCLADADADADADGAVRVLGLREDETP